MIYYEIECITCKQLYKAIEGTALYRWYKEHPNERTMCPDCSRKIEKEAQKQFLG